MWELDYKEGLVLKNWCFWTAVLEKTLEESCGQQGDPTSPSQRKSVLNIHWKDWCWSWNSNTLATWCKELTHLTHLKRPWYWARLKVGGEGDDREWDGWMASLTCWTWVWASSRRWWWMGKLDMLWSMGLQRVWHDWVTELNWMYIGHMLTDNIDWFSYLIWSQFALHFTFQQSICLNYWTYIGHQKVKVTWLCLTLCDAINCSLPDSSVMGFSRQEYWSG